MLLKEMEQFKAQAKVIHEAMRRIRGGPGPWDRIMDHKDASSPLKVAVREVQVAENILNDAALLYNEQLNALTARMEQEYMEPNENNLRKRPARKMGANNMAGVGFDPAGHPPDRGR